MWLVELRAIVEEVSDRATLAEDEGAVLIVEARRAQSRSRR